MPRGIEHSLLVNILELAYPAKLLLNPLVPDREKLAMPGEWIVSVPVSLRERKGGRENMKNPKSKNQWSATNCP